MSKRGGVGETDKKKKHPNRIDGVFHHKHCSSTAARPVLGFYITCKLSLFHFKCLQLFTQSRAVLYGSKNSIVSHFTEFS